MRYVLTIQAAALAAVVSLAGAGAANEPCATCGKGVTPTLAPKPACDNKIYPLSEYHYYKRYCGPVISPNATYGVFQTQWRPWDGGTNQSNCATATQTTQVAPDVLAPAAADAAKPATPSTLPTIKPETKPMTPPAGPSKETIPAPKPADRG